MPRLDLHQIIDLFSRYTRSECSVEDTALLLEAIKPNKRLSKEESLNIYKKSYLTNLSGAIESTYPATAWALEDSLFQALCEEYVLEHPSEEYNLNLYGEDFPQFLLQHAVSENIPFISDLAQFELLLYDNLQKPHEEAIDPEYFASYVGSTNEIHFKQDCFIFSSLYQVSKIYFSKGLEIEQLDFNWESPEYIMVFRLNNKNQVAPLTYSEFILISLLMNNFSLEESFERAEEEGADFSPDEVQDLFYKLQLWQCVTSLPDQGISGHFSKLK